MSGARQVDQRGGQLAENQVVRSPLMPLIDVKCCWLGPPREKALWEWDVFMWTVVWVAGKEE